MSLEAYENLHNDGPSISEVMVSWTLTKLIYLFKKSVYVESISAKIEKIFQIEAIMFLIYLYFLKAWKITALNIPAFIAELFFYIY